VWDLHSCVAHGEYIEVQRSRVKQGSLCQLIGERKEMEAELQKECEEKLIYQPVTENGRRNLRRDRGSGATKQIVTQEVTKVNPAHPFF